LSDPIVGIDLGTSNSVVSHVDSAGAPQVLADDTGVKIHPSVVSFHPNGGVIVGAAAKQRKVIDPQNTIYSVKRLIGRSFTSPEVTQSRRRVPYQIKDGPDASPVIVTRAGDFAIPEISAIVLDHMRNIARGRLGADVSRAVITVPASFNDAQRSATATAGAIAGITVVRVLNEPTAAALAYGHMRDLRQVIAVYDFGGGTFDITILKLDDQVYEVLGTAGDTFLGGDDLDERIVDRMVAKFLTEHRIDLRTNEVSMMRLRAVAEQTKIELSRRSRAVVRIDEIAYGPNGVALNLNIEISRDEFVRQVADIIDRTFPVCQEALAVSGVSVDRIDDILLVGGSTKIPYVRDQVGRFFGKQPRTELNPEEAVALGAGLQAATLQRLLAKPRSGRIPVQQPPPELEDSITEAMDMKTADSITMPASEAPKPFDSGTTGYSVRRSGVRDAVPPLEPRSGEITRPGEKSFDTRTPPHAQPIGRMTRQQVPTPTAPLVPPPLPQGVGQKTLFGVVPAAAPPKPPARPETEERTDEAPALSMVPLPTRPPAPPHKQTTAMPGPNALRPPAPPVPPPTPASTLPMAPSSPIAPPTAPTLVALAPDFAAEVATAERTGPDFDAISGLDTGPDLDAPTGPDLAPAGMNRQPSSAASTAKGMGPVITAPGIMPPQPLPIAGGGPPFSPPARQAPVVLEVTPRGLGIGTVAGFCEELIRRNSRLPAEMKKLFTTSRDQQATVRIVVCQGESRRLDNNVVIGDLILQDLPPRPRGETSIEVTFSVDASGILHVHARDAQTGREQRASLDLVGGMQDVAASRDRIQQLRR
jgi:molecular chaperone DnaK